MQPSVTSSQPAKQTSILIAEDHALFSQGLCIMLESTGQFAPIHQARNGREAVDMTAQHKPTVILMDIAMPELNGLEAAKIIKAEDPSVKIIMLTSFTDTRSVKMAMASGVEGYCSKEIESNRLISVIQLVLEGGIYLDPAIAHFVLHHWFKTKPERPIAQPTPASINPAPPVTQNEAPPATQAPPPSLQSPQPTQTDATAKATPNETAQPEQPRPVEKLDIPKALPIRTDVLSAREMELLSLVADYRSNEEISKILSISIDWVNGYLRTIVSKLGVDNEIQAVRRAVEDGAIQKAAILEQSQYQS